MREFSVARVRKGGVSWTVTQCFLYSSTLLFLSADRSGFVAATVTGFGFVVSLHRQQLTEFLKVCMGVFWGGIGGG